MLLLPENSEASILAHIVVSLRGFVPQMPFRPITSFIDFPPGPSPNSGRGRSQLLRTTADSSSVAVDSWGTRYERMLLMPGSFMVTPYQVGAASMVVGLWVMSRNWLRWLNSRTRWVNFSTFAPSRGASTSSSRTKGLGLTA